MDWWLWIIIVLAVLVLAVAGFLGVQARRRRGGVISSRDLTGRGGSS